MCIFKFLTNSFFRDLRAKLEFSVDKLLDACCATEVRNMFVCLIVQANTYWHIWSKTSFKEAKWENLSVVGPNPGADVFPQARTEETEVEANDVLHDTEFLKRSREVTAIVRKELAVALRDLMHHGLGQVRADLNFYESFNLKLWILAIIKSKEHSAWPHTELSLWGRSLCNLVNWCGPITVQGHVYTCTGWILRFQGVHRRD